MSTAVKGYAGACLRIDLDRGEGRAVALDPVLLRDYLGGTGLAARILFDEEAAGTDPLAPEALFIIATGPLTGNAVPGGGSVELCFKSPLTGGWGESRSGSDFGPDLRRAGFDLVVIRGRAKRPTAIVIRDGQVEFREADGLVGKTVSEKDSELRGKLGEGSWSVACIGPGGENLVAFAAVMFGDRAAGRCGAGAVLGSKNLLAIAVRGTGSVELAEPEGWKRLLRESFSSLKANPTAAAFHDHGTMGDLASNDAKGDWPTANWRSNSWGKGAELFDRYEKRNFRKPYPCYRGCPISCGRKVSVPDGPYQTPEHGGAEYESISSFTAYVLNEDVDAAVHASYLCNEYGIDTISTGASIAFAMECAEAGLLDKAMVASLDLRWGNPAILPVLVRMIAMREGLGALLAGGVRKAAAVLGPAAEPFAVHVKGLEGPAHDGRSGKALALSYGTANRGMCHIHPAEAMGWDSGKMDWGLSGQGLGDPQAVDRFAEAGKGGDVKLLQDGLNLPDILGTCKFFMYAGIGVDELAAMLALATGWPLVAGDLLAVSERVINLQRLFNLREGMTRADDRLPARAVAVPSSGAYAGRKECGISDYPAMLREYYEARGWDPDTGIPTGATLERLGLS